MLIDTVALQAFSTERIQDTAAWLKERMPDATILAQHVIAPWFLEELESNVMRTVEEKLWTAVEVCLEVEMLVSQPNTLLGSSETSVYR